MRIVIDISKDRYDEIMSMDWKNGRLIFNEEIIAIHDGKVFEQETKAGCWTHKHDDAFDWYECSSCGYGAEGEVEIGDETPYCPNCGAKMKVEAKKNMEKCCSCKHCQEEPKIEHWIVDEYGTKRCPSCNIINNTEYDNYCPNCGVKLSESQYTHKEKNDMHEESIEKLNKWFDDEARSSDTERSEYGAYFVSSPDMKDFCDYLRENEKDLIGIHCMVGNDGVWFKRADLESAKYY